MIMAAEFERHYSSAMREDAVVLASKPSIFLNFMN
jgi:hypothetical protein